MVFSSGRKSELQKQLDLGERYLSEMNYEEAVVAFERAIELEPKSVDAYIGLADAYLGLGDADAAIAALQEGYELTQDERLSELLEELMETEENGSDSLENNPEDIEGSAEDNYFPVRFQLDDIASQCLFDGRRAIDWTFEEAKALQAELENADGMGISYVVEDKDPHEVDLRDDVFELWWITYEEGSYSLTVRRPPSTTTPAEDLLLWNRSESFIGMPVKDYLETLIPGLSAHVGTETMVRLDNGSITFSVYNDGKSGSVRFWVNEEDGLDVSFGKFQTLTLNYGDEFWGSDLVGNIDGIVFGGDNS